MNEGCIVSFLSHPLGFAMLTVIIAAITSVVTVNVFAAQRPPAAAIGTRSVADEAKAAAPATDHGAIIAVIAAAAAATLGERRILYIGEAQIGSRWVTTLRSRHHASHMPQTRTATDHRAAERGDVIRKRTIEHHDLLHMPKITMT